MANIKLKSLITEAEDFQAKSKQTGKLVHFKSKDSYQAALKAGTHEDPKAKKGGQPKADATPNSMFGTDYKKDRGAEAPKDNSNWMDDLDSIDTSDIKGKADPNADSFTSGDLYGATFKDPQTGKTITVGDAYEREDDSPAYQKAFAYVSKFDPDKEAVMGTQAYDDLNKKEAPKASPTINSKNWKPDEDGSMSDEASDDVQNYLNDILGADGSAEVDYNTGNIQYGLADSENSIFVGYADGTYNVSFEGPSMDIDKINQSYKSFKNPKEAVQYAGELAKANMKGLGMDDKAPKANLPKKASQLNYKHAESLGNVLNAEVGLDGYVDTDDNTDAIMFHGNSKGNSPTYTLYFGGNDDYNKPDEFRVSLLPTYDNDPAGLGDGNVDKSFKSADDAMKFMIAVAKKYKKELQMDDDDTNESTKLMTMIKK